MSDSRSKKWAPAFTSSDETEARIILGFLQGYGFETRLVPETTKKPEKLPFLKGMARHYHSWSVLVDSDVLNEALELIRDYEKSEFDKDTD